MDREISLEFEQGEKIKWKDFTVGVMGASANNKEAIENGYWVGKMLAQSNFGVVNGGYDVGGMGATAKGFKEVCKEQGASDYEVEDHFVASVLSEKVIGQELAKQRKYIEPAKKIEADSLSLRMSGIIDRSNAVVVLSGGIGTVLESMATTQGEWFRQLKTAEGMGRPNLRPTIVIDSKNTLAKVITLSEVESPKTIGTISDDIFVLAGHKIESGEIATLANDPEMREEMTMILDYYYLSNLGKNNLDAEQSSRLDEVRSRIENGLHRFRLLKDIVEEKKDAVKGAMDKIWSE